MPKTGSCETPYEIAEKIKKQEIANRPLRPVTTEEEEIQKANNKLLMKMKAQSNLEIEDIKRKELAPKVDEIAPDNPQKRELEEHLKREEEKRKFKFCPHCGGSLDYSITT